MRKGAQIFVCFSESSNLTKFPREKSHFLNKTTLLFDLYALFLVACYSTFPFMIIYCYSFFRFPNEVFLEKHLTVCIQKQADNAGDKTSRSSKVTTEPQEVFIEGDIKDEPLDISENIDAVTGEFITGDI